MWQTGEEVGQLAVILFFMVPISSFKYRDHVWEIVILLLMSWFHTVYLCIRALVIIMEINRGFLKILDGSSGEKV